MWILPVITQAKAQIKRILGSLSLSGGLIVDPDGNSVAPYEFTMAQFATLVSTDWSGITIRITDIHQDSRGVGGILVTGGASWTLESPQIYYATFPSAPNPATYPGWRITGPWAGLGSPLS